MTEAGYAKMFDCDTARIVAPTGKLFLIIGWNRNTRQKKAAHWFKNGKPMHLDYVAEQVIASGKNHKELLKSARRYKRLLKREPHAGTSDDEWVPQWCIDNARAAIRRATGEEVQG